MTTEGSRRNLFTREQFAHNAKVLLGKKSEKQYYTCRLSMGADSTKIEIFNLNSNKY